MAGNGNRGPNDFRGRNGRRRREPPIIDASATEVSVEPEAPAAGPEPFEPSRPEGEPVSDPVLFGGARRVAEAAPAEKAASETPAAEPFEAAPAGRSAPADDPAPADRPGPEAAPSWTARPPEAPAAGGEPAVVPSALDGEPAPGEPAPSAVPEAQPSAEGAMPDPVASPAPAGEPSESPVAGHPTDPDAASAADAASAVDPAPVPNLAPAGGAAFVPPAPEQPARADAAEPPRSVPPVPPAARSGGAAPWLLGLSNLVLLGALAWVLYAAPGRHAVADLRRQVAALEARPDPSKVQGDVSALGERLGAADADRQTLSKSVADLAARLDTVAEAARSAKADAGAAQSDANRPAPTGAAAPATVGALAALAARVEGVDRTVSTLSADQGRTAKAVADLPKPVPPDFGPVNARVAGVETQLSGRVAALDGRLAALDGKVNGLDARLNGFDARLNAVDAKVNGSDARMNGVDARANALESRLNDGAAGLARLRTAVADLPKVDLQPLQAAAAGLDRRVAAVEGELSASKDGQRVTMARAVGSADVGRATPIALVGEAVARAVADGRPYGPDLDALKALGAEPDTLAKLQPFAASGAPTAAALEAQWAGVRDDVLAAVRPAAPGASALDRLAGSALSLVKVQRVGAVPGDDGSAVVSQIDAALDAGDVAGALAAWDRLPPAGQDRSKAWAAAARAKLDAAGAAQALVSRAIATLGKADD